MWNAAIPELTAETIMATFRDMYDNRGAMFNEDVIAVYKSLSRDYKTNRQKKGLPVQFGTRFIVEYVLCDRHCATRTRSSAIDDLQRVMCMFNGEPEPDYRQGYRV